MHGGACADYGFLLENGIGGPVNAAHSSWAQQRACQGGITQAC